MKMMICSFSPLQGTNWLKQYLLDNRVENGQCKRIRPAKGSTWEEGKFGSGSALSNDHTTQVPRNTVYRLKILVVILCQDSG